MIVKSPRLQELTLTLLRKNQATLSSPEFHGATVLVRTDEPNKKKGDMLIQKGMKSTVFGEEGDWVC